MWLVNSGVKVSRSSQDSRLRKLALDQLWGLSFAVKTEAFLSALGVKFFG